MSQPNYKAPHAHNHVSDHTIARDPRTDNERFVSFLQDRDSLFVVMTVFLITPWFWPEWTIPSFSAFLLLYFWRFLDAGKTELPLRMPATSGLTDYSQPNPGRAGFSKAKGVFMLGNIFGSPRLELWLTIRDVLTHMLVFGTTGSGKTEFLVSMAFNALAMGAGLFYIDPKASPKLTAQIATMCRLCARDDDFRVLNYQPKTTKRNSPLRTTNNTNPFAYGNAEALSELLISLIPSSEGGNAIFSQKGMALMRALMRILVELRDKGELQLSTREIRNHMSLNKVIELCQNQALQESSRQSLVAFMESLSWNPLKKVDEQPRSLAEQYSYAQSYFNAPLNALTDTYGHIYDTEMGEVDLVDVVLNRRILVIPIPSLKMSPEELKNLGKINLSAVRMAIAVGLGDGKEGAYEEVLYGLPTDAPAPFISITDEYAAIPTPGYIEVLTQGRGLGIGAIVASQDYSGITKADKEGAEQMLENTKIKIAMAMTTAGATWDVLCKQAGKTNVLEVDGMEIIEDSTVSTGYRNRKTMGFKERDRIKLSDLENQIEGEFHAFFRGKILRGLGFYANPDLPPNAQIRIPQLLKVNISNEPVTRTVLNGETGLVKQDAKETEQTNRATSLPQQSIQYPDPDEEFEHGFVGPIIQGEAVEDDRYEIQEIEPNQPISALIESNHSGIENEHSNKLECFVSADEKNAGQKNGQPQQTQSNTPHKKDIGFRGYEGQPARHIVIGSEPNKRSATQAAFDLIA